MSRATIYHIPVCPFSQRVEILLELCGLDDIVEFQVMDITLERPQWFLDMTRGTTAMPVLRTEQGQVIKESLVILQYMLELHAQTLVRADPYERALERMLIAKCDAFVGSGYRSLLNQDPDARAALEAKHLAIYAQLDDFLSHHAPTGPFLFEDYGLAELVFTPMFQRFTFLEYYENFELPAAAPYTRVLAWRAACMKHPAAQQVSHEEIVKLYYDYSRGAGNGKQLPGRQRSSLVFEPSWRARPWPPREKYGDAATDAELGLLA